MRIVKVVIFMKILTRYIFCNGVSKKGYKKCSSNWVSLHDASDQLLSSSTYSFLFSCTMSNGSNIILHVLLYNLANLCRVFVSEFMKSLAYYS